MMERVRVSKANFSPEGRQSHDYHGRKRLAGKVRNSRLRSFNYVCIALRSVTIRVCFFRNLVHYEQQARQIRRLEHHPDLLGVADDMKVGDDLAIGADQRAGAEGGAGQHQHHGGRGGLIDLGVLYPASDLPGLGRRAVLKGLTPLGEALVAHVSEAGE